MAPIWTWALCQKEKWADTLVTEWDPCHDSVLAIGEQCWPFKSGDLLNGCYKGPQQNHSFILTHFLVEKKKKAAIAAAIEE